MADPASSESGLRRRKVDSKSQSEANDVPADHTGEVPHVERDKAGGQLQVRNIKTGSYWLSRIVFIRSLGLVYCKLYFNCKKARF